MGKFIQITTLLKAWSWIEVVQVLYAISKKSCPILFSKLLYNMDEDFLIIQYV